MQNWVLIIVGCKFLETSTPLRREIQSVVQSDLCLCCGFCYDIERMVTCEVSHITLCFKPTGLLSEFPFVLINIIWKSYQQWGKYKMFELLSSWLKNFFLMILCQTWESFTTYWSKILDKIKWYYVVHMRRCDSCCMSCSCYPVPLELHTKSCNSLLQLYLNSILWICMRLKHKTQSFVAVLFPSHHLHQFLTFSE